MVAFPLPRFSLTWINSALGSCRLDTAAVPLLNRLIQACEPVDSLTHLTGPCIFDSARSNNTRLHPSGMLGVDGCHFLWVLEGCAHI